MGLSIGLLCTMGGVAVASSILEKVLGKFGEIDKANMLGIVSTTMIATTVVASVSKVFIEVRKLGK